MLGEEFDEARCFAREKWMKIELTEMLRKIYTLFEKLSRLWRKNPHMALNLLSDYNEISI